MKWTNRLYSRPICAGGLKDRKSVPNGIMYLIGSHINFSFETKTQNLLMEMETQTAPGPPGFYSANYIVCDTDLHL